jgi:aryl-alcohol dehydrogenase-like predicted oxidoreductase
MRDLILGTAIFVPEYGISNSTKTFFEIQGEKLIEDALSLGIKHFDTAPSYGEAERVLGSLTKSRNDISISTKVSPEACLDPKIVKRTVMDSLERLGRNEIEILFLHDENALLSEHAIELISELLKLKEEGIYKKLGVSIYTERSLKILRTKYPEIDVFQVPENICDRRLRNSSLAQVLMEDHREYILRSVFLQGLLLMSEQNIPIELAETKIAVTSVDSCARDNGLKSLDLCLAYARSIPWCSSIIVGVSSKEELQEIVNSNSNLPISWETRIPTISKQLVDPRNWKF